LKIESEEIYNDHRYYITGIFDKNYESWDHHGRKSITG
jgi:hypothetical protein